MKFLLLVLTLLILGRPIFFNADTGTVIETVLLSLILFTACFTLDNKFFIVIAFVSAFIVNTFWFLSAHIDNPLFYSKEFHLISLLLALIFLIISSGAIVKKVFSKGFVDTNKLCGAVVIYLLIGFIFSLIFECALIIEPGSLVSSTSGGEVIDLRGLNSRSFISYYSFVTLTTLGYGDIIPATITTRTLAIVEAMIGQLFVAILIARLVSLSLLKETNQTQNDAK